MAVISWLGMMAVHESGHALAAHLTGGIVERVVLHPATISRTDVRPNPQPMVVVWAGPLFGVVAPLLIWGVVTFARPALAYLPRFFAGFCLIANGAYIGAGSFDGIGDAGEMLRRGSPIWMLWAFGIVAVPAGLYLWHGLGPRFGFGRSRRVVDKSDAWGCAVVAAAITFLCFWIGE